MKGRWKRFLSYYKPYWRLLLADIVCAMVLSAITLVLPLYTRHITKTILANTAPDMLWQIYGAGAVMLVLIAVYIACNMFVDYRGHMMGALIEHDLRRELFDHYQRLPMSFYDQHKTGQLMSVIAHDSFWLAEFYHHGPEDLLIAVLKFSGALVILFVIDWRLSLLVTALLPFFALYTYYFNKRMRRALQRSVERVSEINAQVEDTLAGIRVVTSFTNEELERQKFAVANKNFVRARGDGYLSEAFVDSGMQAFAQLLSLVVIVFGGVAIVRNTLDLADLLAYLLCVGILLDPIERVVNFSRLYQEGITGFNRCMEILELQPAIQDAPQAHELGRVRGEIEFRDVYFRYGEQYDDVLKGFSLKIEAGEYVALVGFSGVGKSTICSLIPRFYDVTGGSVMVDGYDVRDVTLHSLRRNIGIVHQDSYLFSGTVAQAIAYGDLSASREQVIAAAKQANAHDFIMQLPQGYDTDIGQRGVKLSGGQKQRLSIARMFLKNPPIIILDEATSALDNVSEQAVQRSLEELAMDRTMIVIAHRLSTIRNAQRIIVLNEDGIVEQGTHEELLALGGEYANTYNLHVNIV